jgi:hypothetical protein
VRFFQLIAETRLAVRDFGEETVFEVMRQEGTVLQILDRLPLSVQDSLYSLDDDVAMGEEEVQEFDVLVKCDDGAPLLVTPS